MTGKIIIIIFAIVLILASFGLAGENEEERVNTKSTEVNVKQENNAIYTVEENGRNKTVIDFRNIKSLI